jgi:ACT domain-containing protein
MFVMMETVLKNDRSVDLKEVKMLRVEHLYQNGFPIASACKTVGISVHTYYKWRTDSQPDVQEKVGSAVIAVQAE